jgi:uncharacterized protein YyaL (SSP411 family)
MRIMKTGFTLHLALAAVTLGLGLGMVSCRKTQSDGDQANKPLAKIAPELLSNQLSALPGAIPRSQALSPIHWQPWTKETLARAKDAQRLVLCVIAIPQQPGFLGTLKELAADKTVVDDINQNYVPVLVDGDAAREMSILTSDLCAEIKRGLNLPLLVWMTHEANPVAWIPVTASEPTAVRDLFNQSHMMVSQMWNDSPDYVLKNSALDNANRRARIKERKNVKVMSEQPAVDVVRCLRQLASLYDPYSRSFDETGGLFPSSSLELLSAAAVHPGLPDDARSRCMDTARELLIDLLPSAMFDPLDGGVFSSRRGTSWALPAFMRECPSQARVAVALLEAYRATGNTQALDKALALIAHAEKTHATPEGLFAVGLMRQTDPSAWMWQVEDIRKILAPEDADWWIKATGMQGLGNLPSEVDPQREFFRGNTLGLSKSVAGLAAELGQPLATFAPRFDAVRAKLLAERDRRIGKVTRDETAHAPSTFRMVSAHAAAFTATGDDAYRQKAASLLQKARESFSDGPRLRVFAQNAPASVGTARAFLYALQSVLDVAAITSDEQWLVWAEDLATTAAELFTHNDFLKECPDDAKLIDLPVTDLVMLFDDSTAGLVSMAECRLAEIGRPLVRSFSQLATPMPTYALDRPVLHTDLLLATVARHYKVTAIYGSGLPPEMKLAVERLPLRVVQRRPAKSDEQVPAGSVKLLFGEEEREVMVSTPQSLKQAILPPGGNSGNLPPSENPSSLPNTPEQ